MIQVIFFITTMVRVNGTYCKSVLIRTENDTFVDLSIDKNFKIKTLKESEIVSYYLKTQKTKKNILLDSRLTSYINFLALYDETILIYDIYTNKVLDLCDYVSSKYDLIDYYKSQTYQYFLFMMYFLENFCNCKSFSSTELFKQIKNRNDIIHIDKFKIHIFCLEVSINMIGLNYEDDLSSDLKDKIITALYDVLLNKKYMETNFSPEEVSTLFMELCENKFDKLEYIMK